jgi:O-methyltransferase
MTLSQQSLKMLSYAEQICYSSKETLRFTYDCAVKMKDKEGVYVECGVAAGAQIIAMAAGAPDKIIYAFDSFQGIPLPSNRDNQMPGIKFLNESERKSLPNPGEQVLETTGATSVSEEDFKNHLLTAGVNLKNIVISPGWFEHTVKLFGQLNVNISILRLDGDLYNSTYVCLQHLFPRVCKGGIVIIDDWQLPGCREAVYDYFTELKGVYKWPLNMKFISNIAYFEK